MFEEKIQKPSGYFFFAMCQKNRHGRFMEEIKIFASAGKNVPNFEMFDARVAS